MFTRYLLCTSACALVLSLSFSAQARHSDIPNITITPIDRGSLTVPSIQIQREILNLTPGSVGFVDSESYQNTYANDLRDTLKDTPGVYVQNRYGQEMRLSIRGSGIGRSFHARGIEILQDGIPTNLADGSGDYYQIDPLALRSIEVFKGGNGLAYGASTLGGAVNFVTPTAHTALAENIVRLEGGSFNTIRGNGQVSRAFENWDFMINGTVTHANNYREHDDTQAEAVNGNLGYRFNADTETRFYLGAFIVDQDLPGALSLQDALHNPTKAATTALTGDQARDTRTFRLANRTSFNLDHGKIDLDIWGIQKDLFHPIFQALDQSGWTYGIGPRYSGSFVLSGHRNDLIVGGRFVGGNNEALQFQNINGSRGRQTLDARQNAYNFEAYAENRFWFHQDAAFMTGAKFFHSIRDYEDKGGLALNPTPKSDRETFNGVNPKVGFLWQPQKDIQAFVNVTRSQDVPDFSDLAQTFATTTQFVPLDMQDAWTFEIGTRGAYDRYAWDFTYYRSWIRDELLQYTTGPGIPATTFNADKTLHQGVELGMSAEILRDIFPEAGDMIKVSQLWNYSDFRFENDARYGDNRIAGVPEHLLRTEVTYTNKHGFYITPTVDWVPDGAFADQANTLRAPGYVLFGLQTGIQLENGLLFYVDARNLNDERYISDISVITDARTAGTSIFYPGAGRSVFAGVRYVF